MKNRNIINGLMKQEQGSVLVLVLALIVVVGIVAGGLIQMSAGESRLLERKGDGQQALASAESTFQAVALTMRDNDTWYNSYWSIINNVSGYMPTPAGTAVVNVEIIGGMRANITSTATYDGVTKEIVVVLDTNKGLAGPPGAGSFRAASPGILGNSLVDGRNHNLDGSLANDGTGVHALVLEASEADYSMSAATSFGSNVENVDYDLVNTTDDRVFFGATNLPETPDEIYNLPEGTLRSMAENGNGQLVIDPQNNSNLNIVDGINWVELTNCNNPSWRPRDLIMPDDTTSAVLILQMSDACDSSVEALLDSNRNWTFRGVLIADGISLFHGTIIGGLMGLGEESTDIIGNGGGTVLYSQKAVDDTIDDSGGGPSEPELTMVSWTETRMR